MRCSLPAVSTRRIFHVASNIRTPWVANSPPIPWVIVILAFGICRLPASCALFSENQFMLNRSRLLSAAVATSALSLGMRLLSLKAAGDFRQS